MNKIGIKEYEWAVLLLTVAFQSDASTLINLNGKGKVYNNIEIETIYMEYIILQERYEPYTGFYY